MGPARAVLALLVLLPCAAPAAVPAESEDDPAESPPIACTCSEQCAGALGYGNVCREGACVPYHDRSSLLDLVGLAREGAPTPPPMKLLPAVLPAIGYNPAMGLLLGVTGTLAMYLGPPATTPISNLQLVALVTSMRQIVFHSSSVIVTSGNRWQLHGDWRFLIFNQDTYGLGTGPSAMDAPASRDDFQLVRVHENVMRQVVGALYVGAGYRLDRFFAVQDVGMDLSAPSPVVGPNHAYSLAFGFNPHEYTVSGLTLAALYDTRDSTIAPYRGVYAAAAFTANPLWLGSTRTSTMLEAQLRAYVPMNVDVPRDVLAFWLYYHGITSGIAPYLALPAIGWEDYRNRTGRGYVQGRWRGTHELYAEAEWRFRITGDGLLGGVLFASVVTFASPAFQASGPGWSYASPRTNLLQYLRPAGGFGIRLLMNRDSRATVTLDLAWGESSFGVWLNAGEYF